MLGRIAALLFAALPAMGVAAQGNELVFAVTRA